ncbi:MAG: hypothetical protein CMK29_06280 [Porticoccaceae bacterium]|nr:hypothetical protein [Porticoccaceae bacterium]OUW58480.1 MAG: hypothetical protein CBD57_02900 [Candidatus Pelagibacter sp. TMED197]|tara:strand:+ start:471 stop:671 length:201 start_codon:yes stop_codon:yes gene_type:complete
MGRFTELLKNFANNSLNKKKENVLLRARKEVGINDNGTSGFTIKEGPNKGRVLGHISVKHSNTKFQ